MPRAVTSPVTDACTDGRATAHEADLADDRFDEPGAAGLGAICRGLSRVLDDQRTLDVTGAVFDGLYELRRQLLRGDRPG